MSEVRNLAGNYLAKVVVVQRQQTIEVLQVSSLYSLIQYLINELNLAGSFKYK